ncbi:hypothetical protein MICAF_700006 [Microcystis aeruginosa PCC 9807]|uniref:Uncharacterized protein n=1 Tax=Microcystis aeruginosa PCC 9807 TaxID=1160283 RepID=I4HEB5_MICAE|nr:hypothetical protein MICAF_700006 [Microcystis aeruginosa PCC 9807]
MPRKQLKATVLTEDLPHNYILQVNFLYNTLQSNDMGQLSVYYTQKPVSQISLLQTISFKETDHRSLLEF